MGLVISEGNIKTTKAIDHLILLAMESLKIGCFVSVAQTVWVLCAFVYSTIDINKIMMIFFSKTAFIHIRTINYTAKTIAYFICQSLVNILSQISTM